MANLDDLPPLGHDLERSFHWTFEASFDENDYLVGWYQVRNDHYLGIWKMSDPVVELVQGPIYDALRAAAQSFGASMARDRLHLRHAYAMSMQDMVMAVIEEARTGAYVGQSGSILYVQDIARVLDYGVSQVWDACEELRFQRKIGLDAAMIIPIEWDDKNRQIGLDQTGHRDLHLSDFGGWACGYCGRSGNPDEGDKYASEVPCERREFPTV